LIIENFLFPFLILKLLFEVSVKFFVIAFVSWRLEVHFLYGLLFLLNLVFDLFDFFGNLFDKSFHDSVFFIKSNKNIQQLLALIFYTHFSDSNLFSDSIKALLDFHFLHDTLLVLIIDSGVFFLLYLDLFLIFFDLLL
jgi:hypothetical protein